MSRVVVAEMKFLGNMEGKSRRQSMTGEEFGEILKLLALIGRLISNRLRCMGMIVQLDKDSIPENVLYMKLQVQRKKKTGITT